MKAATKAYANTAMWAALYAQAKVGDTVAMWDGGGDDGYVKSLIGPQAADDDIWRPETPEDQKTDAEKFDDWLRQVVYDALEDAMNMTSWADGGGRHLTGVVTLTEYGLSCRGAETNADYDGLSRLQRGSVTLTIPPGIAECLRRIIFSFGQTCTIGGDHPGEYTFATWNNRAPDELRRFKRGNYQDLDNDAQLGIFVEYEDGLTPDGAEMSAWVDSVFAEVRAAADAYTPSGDNDSGPLRVGFTRPAVKPATIDIEGPDGPVRVAAEDEDEDDDEEEELFADISDVVLNRGVDDLTAPVTIPFLFVLGSSTEMTAFIRRDGSGYGDSDDSEESDD